LSPHALKPLFDFALHKPQRDEILALIREFAGQDPYRSAVVSELQLDDDFYRRPLRPEDLEFLKFQKPVSGPTVSRLQSLATNRLLLSINELGVARLPRRSHDGDFQRYETFYDENVQVLGTRIRPFLESYGFSYLSEHALTQADRAGYAATLTSVYEAQRAHWSEMFELLSRNDYLEQGLRFILVQQWALAPSRRVALARAQAAGYFAPVVEADRPRLAGALPADAALERMAAMMQVSKLPHSYWQFYLPTSLSKANLLYALGSRPDRAFALLGAAYIAEVEWLAYGAALMSACPHLAHGSAAPADAGRLLADTLARFGRAFSAVEEANGPAALMQLGQGLGAGAKLAERGRWDLGEQLRWLSAIPRYCVWAKEIDQRIAAECPGIDRETFVEPREMCSTTHVHNDHRLVVIEEGDMIFWGNVGMQLPMTVGEMVLIPDGRLHGSTVTSAQCTYHQPIIPDEWIAELLAREDRVQGQLVR